MAKDDLIEIEGKVTDVFPGGKFLVETEAGTEVQAHLGGRLRKFHIKVVKGDRVKVGVTPYDLNRGLISYRYK